MKRSIILKSILFLFLLVNIFTLHVAAQESKNDGPPIVKLFNGNIINAVPYQRVFFIEGDLPDLGKWHIDKVTIQIYEIGDNKENKEFEKKSEKEKESTFPVDKMPTYVKDEWLNVNDESKMKFFVSKGLRFNYSYYLRFVYDLKLEITSQEDINDFSRDIETQILKYANDNYKKDVDRLAKSKMKEIIFNSYKKFLTNAYLKNALPNQLNNDSKYSANNFDILFDQTFTDENIENLSKYFANYFYRENFINQNQVNIDYEKSEIKNLTDKLPNSSDVDKKELEKKIEEKDKAIDHYNNYIKADEILKIEYLESIKKFFSDDFKPFIKNIFSTDNIVTAGIATVQDLETVRVGTVFGGGATWLNAGNDSYPVGFGYVGLKFFFYPVDKRLIDPYLGSNPTLNRLSFLVGFALNSDNMQYHGQELSPLVLNTFPMLGLSYDFNRYFGIDVGGMFFMYDNISELKSSSILRASPFVTLSFDIDLFNRFKKLFQGEPYSLKEIGSIPNQ